MGSTARGKGLLLFMAAGACDKLHAFVVDKGKSRDAGSKGKKNSLSKSPPPWVHVLVGHSALNSFTGLAPDALGTFVLQLPLNSATCRKPSLQPSISGGHSSSKPHTQSGEEGPEQVFQGDFDLATLALRK